MAQVLAAAQMRLPQGAWRIVHAPDGALAEPVAPMPELGAASGAAPRWEADASIEAGLKVVADGNAIDGTQAGLLADRPAIEARLLRELEAR